MIIVMKNAAGPDAVDRVVAEIERMGNAAHLSRGQFRTVIGAVGEEGSLDTDHLATLDGVEKVVPIMKPYKLASREFHEDDSVVSIGGDRARAGRGRGRRPRGVHRRAVRGRERGDAQPHRPARPGRRGRPCCGAGCSSRGRRRTRSRGLGLEALGWMRACGDELGMPICVEVMDTRQVEQMEPLVDCFQIGGPATCRTSTCCGEVGKTRRAVLLKRGLAATVKDWLLSAEYVLSQGNRNVILCERGIKTFEDSIRYSLDVTSIPVAQHLSHLPVIVDPSHAAGRRDYVPALAAAGMAAGAHGVIVEVHYNPAEAQCDGPQALLPNAFAELIGRLRTIACIFGKEFAEAGELASA